jgi:hypothetical protein
MRSLQVPSAPPLLNQTRLRRAGTRQSLRPCALAVTLRRPLGIVFEERVKGQPGGVYVFEVVKGSNAEKAGVQPGDVLVKVSATVLKDGKEGEFENEGYGQRCVAHKV